MCVLLGIFGFLFLFNLDGKCVICCVLEENFARVVWKVAKFSNKIAMLATLNRSLKKITLQRNLYIQLIQDFLLLNYYCNAFKYLINIVQ